MITPSDVRTRFPEFINLTDAYIQQFIDEAVMQINQARWGRYYNSGVLYLVAHLIAMSQQTAGGFSPGLGMVSSQSVGDTSISYAIPTGIDQDFYYKATAYGLRYLELGQIAGVGGVIV